MLLLNIYMVFYSMVNPDPYQVFVVAVFFGEVFLALKFLEGVK